MLLTEQVKLFMRNLGCTEEEALQLIQDDKDIDKGIRKDFDLSPEDEKKAKKWANVGSRNTANDKPHTKQRENPTKEGIIEDLFKFLSENGYETPQITNKTRQIAFKMGENSFELTLVQKNKKKTT